MKTLILGDIHGRTIWKDIIKKESPKKVIFLGDYFDRSNNSEEDDIENFLEIINLQITMGKDKCIILIGNHDFHYIGGISTYSGYSNRLAIKVKPILEHCITQDCLKLVHIDNKFLFSHAGVSNYWLNNVSKISDIELLNKSNFQSIERNTLDWNDIIGCSFTGDTISNSPIWIRPNSLSTDYIKNYIQVIGHTPVKKILKIYDNIILCDALPKAYGIIENTKIDNTIININI